MDNQELRMQCLRLAVENGTSCPDIPATDLAQRYYDFVIREDGGEAPHPSTCQTLCGGHGELPEVDEGDASGEPAAPPAAKPKKGGRGKPWTDEEDAQLRRLVTQGMKRTDIAEELGRPVTSIYTRLSLLRANEAQIKPTLPSYGGLDIATAENVLGKRLRHERRGKDVTLFYLDGKRVDSVAVQKAVLEAQGKLRGGMQ